MPEQQYESFRQTWPSGWHAQIPLLLHGPPQQFPGTQVSPPRRHNRHLPWSQICEQQSGQSVQGVSAAPQVMRVVGPTRRAGHSGVFRVTGCAGRAAIDLVPRRAGHAAVCHGSAGPLTTAPARRASAARRRARAASAGRSILECRLAAARGERGARGQRDGSEHASHWHMLLTHFLLQQVHSASEGWHPPPGPRHTHLLWQFPEQHSPG